MARWIRSCGFALVFVAALQAVVSPTTAQTTSTWTGLGPSDDWSSSLNWNPLVAPKSEIDRVIIFSGTQGLNPNQNVANPFLLNSLQFSATAGAFDLVGLPLDFRANSIASFPTLIQNSPTAVIIRNNLVFTNTVTYSGIGSADLRGAISGAGGLTLNGTTGTVTLSSNGNSYLGATNILTGTLRMGATKALPAGTAVNVAATGILRLNNFDTTIGSLSGDGRVILGTGDLTVGNATSTTFNGLITGDGGLIKEGSGTLTLSGATDYTRATTINAGTLRMGTTDALPWAPTGSAVTVASGGTLDLNGFTTTLGSLAGAGTVTSLTGSPTMFIGDLGTSTSFSGNITGNLILVKVGNGTLNLGGASTYTNSTIISSGVLRMGAVNALPATTDLSLSAGTVLDLNNFSTTVGSLFGNGNVTQGSGTLTVGNTDSTSYSGVISGSGGLVKQGTGTLTLTVGQTYTGGTTINGGTLKLAAANILPTGTALTVAGTGTLDLNGFGTLVGSLAGTGTGTVTTTAGATTLNVGNDSTDTTFAGNITGGLSLVKSGFGVLTLSGGNTYTNSTTINTGTLRMGAVNALPVGTAVNVSNFFTVLDLNGFDTTIGSIIGSGFVTLGSGTLTVGDASSTSYFGPIMGSGGLTKQGSGMLTLAINNSYTGATMINDGTLRMGAANAVSSGSAVTVTGAGILNLNGFSPTLGSLAGNGTVTTPAGTPTLTVGNNNASTSFSGTLSGALSLVKVGTGTLTLGGPTKTYTGGTTVQAGTLQMGATNVLPTNTLLTVASGGTFALNGFNTVIVGLSGAGNVTLGGGTLTVDNSTVNLFSGVISGNGGVVKQGAADLTLTGNHTYTGTTTVNAGGLLYLGAGGSGSFTVASGASLLFDGGATSPGFGSITAQSGALVSYHGATINGGFLRGPGTHSILSGASTTFNGTTAQNGARISQAGPVTLNNFTNHGVIANTAAGFTWNGGSNMGSGVFSVNNTADVSSFDNSGVITINNGGVLNNSVSNLVSYGGARITVNPGGQMKFGSTTLDLNGSLLVNNGTISGTTNVYFNSLAKGTGTYGPVNVFDGGKFSPGNSPGTVNTGNSLWDDGGTYFVELQDASGTQGTDWDLWAITGILNLDAGNTSNSQFIVQVLTLDGSGNAGQALGFDNTLVYQWRIASATGGVNGFSLAELRLDTTGFANNLGGGTLFLSASSNAVFLNFGPQPVPEPGSLALLGLTGAAVGAWRWRRGGFGRPAPSA